MFAVDGGEVIVTDSSIGRGIIVVRGCVLTGRAVVVSGQSLQMVESESIALSELSRMTLQLFSNSGFYGGVNVAHIVCMDISEDRGTRRGG